MIYLTMRYAQNTMAARREAQSILSVLTSRTTQRRRVRSRREEQVPLACQWMRPRSEMQRTANARSCAHLRGRIPKGPLLRAAVRDVTLRDAAATRYAKRRCGSRRISPRAESCAQPVRPFPLRSSRVRVRGAVFAHGVVARSLFGPAKRPHSRLTVSENRHHRTRDGL